MITWSNRDIVEKYLSHEKHILVLYQYDDAISMMGCMLRIDILRWTNGCSIVPIIGTFGQTCWLSGYVC
jgi:hypothetical protein